MFGLRRLLWIGPLAILMAGMPALAEQTNGGNAPIAPVDCDQGPGFEPALQVPFGAGELAEYQVKLGGIHVGSGSMSVVGVEQVHGYPTYHAQLSVHGGIPFARVDDLFESWIDVCELFSRRFKQNQREISYRRNRTYEFFPDQGIFRRLDNGETGPIPTNRPLDDVSFLYFARTLPLEVGETYELNRYFKADGNPVVLQVLRRDTVRVPAGTFPTIVVRPIIKTEGLFGEGGEAEVYFTDDERRILVQMTSRVPVVGHLSLHLRSYQAGQSLAQASRASATTP